MAARSQRPLGQRLKQGGRCGGAAVTGTKVHVNAMGEAVVQFMRKIGRERIFPGDVYITKDPWKGTGHLHDFTVVSSAFHGDTLIGFFACAAHLVDVGGRSFGPKANEV